MMRLNRLLLLLAIVVPVVACVICVKSLKEINEDGKVDTSSQGTEGIIILSGDSVSNTSSESQEVNQDIFSGEMAGVSYISTIGEPLSKIYQNASVAISVAHIYKEADETSEVVGSTAKYDVITAQKYPKGWSRVTDNKVSGWMRTENITFPEGSTVLNDNSVIGKTGTVTADPSLNLRSSATINATNVITSIPYQAQVTIQDASNGWYKVTYASSTGWVSAEYVEVK